MHRKLLVLNGLGVVALALLVGGPVQARARVGRAHVRTAKVDDECDVRLPKRFKAVTYDRRTHKRTGKTTLALGAGVQIKLVSTVSRSLNGKRSAYYIYRWARRGQQRTFVLDRRVRVPTRYDGVWRAFALLPGPGKRRRGDPPNLVTKLRVVR